jgi:uncharacterized Zn finger protein (UPF0148 family)
MAEQCCGFVASNKTHGWPGLRNRCTRSGKVERDGKWYCGTHDPEAEKARREDRERRWKRERELRDAGRNVEARERDVLKAAVAFVRKTDRSSLGGAVNAYEAALARQAEMETRDGD